MPSIEELLNEAELHMAAQPVNDVLEIDPETREISIPDSEIILGVETDQKAERKYFHCPKIVGNNIDLSTLALYVVFQNASNLDEGKDRYHVTDVVTTSDGYITFSWELSAKVTAYKGDVQFGVCAIKTDSSGAKQNVWNTTIAIGQCLTGLSADMSESEEQSASDLYTQLISELNSTASAKMTEVITQIQTVGQNQVSNVNSAGSTQVQSIKDATDSALASIPSEYTELDSSVKSLESAMRGKAPVITESITCASGSPTTVTDSAEMPLQDMVLYGKSEQVVTSGKNLFGGKVFADKIVELGGVINTVLKRVTIASDVISGKDVYLFSDTSKQYTIFANGFNETSQQQESNMSVEYDDGSADYIGKFVNGQIVFTTDAEKKPVKLRGAWWDGTATFNYEKCGVFEGVLTLSDFEPYTGGKPSPSPEYPQEIVSVGERWNGKRKVVVPLNYGTEDYWGQWTESTLANNISGQTLARWNVTAFNGVQAGDIALIKLKLTDTNRITYGMIDVVNISTSDGYVRGYFIGEQSYPQSVGIEITGRNLFANYADNNIGGCSFLNDNSIKANISNGNFAYVNINQRRIIESIKD